jgi:hypothetical protein
LQRPRVSPLLCPPRRCGARAAPQPSSGWVSQHAPSADARAPLFSCKAFWRSTSRTTCLWAAAWFTTASRTGST